MLSKKKTVHHFHLDPSRSGDHRSVAIVSVVCGMTSHLVSYFVELAMNVNPMMGVEISTHNIVYCVLFLVINL